MPATPETWKETISQFIQNTLTTNTFGEMIGQVSNIWNRYKPWRSAACLTATAGAGGGAVPIFILVPEVYDYFRDIVHQALPFLGKTLDGICVGIIGFWIGGAIGFNLSKFAYREFSLRKNGHTNVEFEISDEKVEAIIEANPDLYVYEKDGEGLTPESTAKRTMDIAQLRTTLSEIRSMIDKYSGDGTTRHDDLKHILLSALRSKDLGPLLEKNATDQAKRDLRINLAAQLAGHLSQVNPEQFKQVNASNAPNLQIHIDEEEEEGVAEGLPAVPMVAPGTFDLRPNVEVFSNAKKRTAELMHSKTIHSNRHRVDTSRARSERSKYNLLQGLGTVVQREAIKKEQDATLVVGDAQVRQRLGLPI